MSKQYGLIKPDKSKGNLLKRPSIFNQDSDSNEDETSTTTKPTGISTLKKKDRLAQEKSLAEDPTIYQYDELYDDMQAKRQESKLARKDLDRKPKYINKLLQSAERRKREYERRIERDVQKEREAEGDKYRDKESFVTESYRQKLEEMKKLDEEEKRTEYLETIADVRKQNDLSGFYRHLYEQQVKFEDRDEIEIKTKTESNEEEENETENKSSENVEKFKKGNVEKEKRTYRKRNDSENDPESDTEIKLQHLQSNLDADSDFSIDSSSDEMEKVEKETSSEIKTGTKLIETIVSDEKTKLVSEFESESEPKSKSDLKKIGDVKEDEKVEEVKTKVDIWKKRTVGVVFDEALIRYYERKAARATVY